MAYNGERPMDSSTPSTGGCSSCGNCGGAHSRRYNGVPKTVVNGQHETLTDEENNGIKLEVSTENTKVNGLPTPLLNGDAPLLNGGAHQLNGVVQQLNGSVPLMNGDVYSPQFEGRPFELNESSEDEYSENVDNLLEPRFAKENGVGSSTTQSSSFDDENEESTSDDFCLYTYTGNTAEVDAAADLPSSFFHLDIAHSEADGHGACVAERVECLRPTMAGVVEIPFPIRQDDVFQNEISPDMDFLEMDFDPSAPAILETELDAESERLRQRTREREEQWCREVELHLHDSVPGLRKEHPKNVVPEVPAAAATGVNEGAGTSRAKSPVAASSCVQHTNEEASTQTDDEPHSRTLTESAPSAARNPIPQSVSYQERMCQESTSRTSAEFDCQTWPGKDRKNKERLSRNSSFNTNTTGASRPERWSNQVTHGQLCELGIDGDMQMVMKYESPFFRHSKVSVGRSFDCKRSAPSERLLDKIMIWSENEALSKQVNQIGTSACGATAVVNVLLALNQPHSVDKVESAVQTRLRANSAPIPEYLLSRSVAGATHLELINAVQEITNNEIIGKFFHCYPKRDVNVTDWLVLCMQKGAIPVLTLNLQVDPEDSELVPDSWHHQMSFGVDLDNIYLTNPCELVYKGIIEKQLCSPSVLLIRRQDIVSRWDGQTDLREILRLEDPRWREMNVLGQIATVLREEQLHDENTECRLTSHISIPAIYQSGVTLFARKCSPVGIELQNAAELPIAVDTVEVEAYGSSDEATSSSQI